MKQEQLAQFDNTRTALVFALNASQVVPPGAAMNRMLAAVATSAEPPKKRRKKGVSWLSPWPGSAEDLLAQEREATRNPRKRDPGNRPAPLAASDRAHQAGIILHHFGKLDLKHRIILTAVCTTSHVPCECRRPCCSGWSAIGQWQAAVHDTCLLLKREADVTHAPGKRGMSTQPTLRRMLVEDFYLQRDTSLTETSRRTHISTKTVALHRNWIFEYLQRTEQEAWEEVSALFDVYGITGSWNRI